MKKLVAIVAGLIFAASLTLNAADAPAKKTQTPEQKALMEEMVKKYDKNGDGKLDKTEKAAMSQEDKDKMKAAGLGGGKKKTQ